MTSISLPLVGRNGCSIRAFVVNTPALGAVGDEVQGSRRVRCGLHQKEFPAWARADRLQYHARHHVRRILALAEIYPADAVARAISDGLAFQAFSAEYITNILETRARALPEPGPLQLTRRHDLLDIDIAPPDLNAYQVNQHDPE